MEDYNSIGSLAFCEGSSSYPLSGMFDELCDSEKSSLGFMELLGVQDMCSSLFDFASSSTPHPSAPNPPSTATKDCSEAFNQPATPNSSSISSASSDAINDEQTKTDHYQDEDDEEEEHDVQQKTKKPQSVFFFLSGLLAFNSFASVCLMREYSFKQWVFHFGLFLFYTTFSSGF